MGEDVFGLGEPAANPRRAPLRQRREPNLGDPVTMMQTAWVGSVISQTSVTWLAVRNEDWGGSIKICPTFGEAKQFIEAACGTTYLRQETVTMDCGTRMIKFYNDAVPNIT